MPPSEASSPPADPIWLLLIHQVPQKPPYFRVKVWRRLQALGAVSVKGGVYALPWSAQAQEDFQWLLTEIQEGGGEGVVCEARLVDGVGDGDVRALFLDARDADYAEIAAELRVLAELTKGPPEQWGEGPLDVRTKLKRLRGRFSDVQAIDFFGASGRETVDGLLGSIDHRVLEALEPMPETAQTASPEVLKGKTWVTRRGVHVDRMACAWAVRRFIDADASFRFVSPKSHEPKEGEVRFDMAGAEFTHEGDHCSLEVIVRRAGLADDAALRAVAEVVHDIDLKDGKFARPETDGVRALINGICLTTDNDEQRLARGAALFDDLYQSFRKRKD